MGFIKWLDHKIANHHKKGYYQYTLRIIKGVKTIAHNDWFDNTKKNIESYLEGGLRARALLEVLVRFAHLTGPSHKKMIVKVETIELKDVQEVAKLVGDNTIVKEFQKAKQFLTSSKPIFEKMHKLCLSMQVALENENQTQIEKLNQKFAEEIQLFKKISKGLDF
jgi:hypothetical protein